MPSKDSASNEDAAEARQGSSGPGSLAALVRLVADRAKNPSTHQIKICLLLGAGADISSGGVSFAALKRQAVEEFSGRVVFDVTQPTQIESRFEDIFVRLPPDDRALMIEFLFRKVQALQPSDAYKLLVLLMEVGGIDAVITTNFDSMLEEAQRQLGRDLLYVYAPGVARPFSNVQGRFEAPKRPYLKLHGDLAARSVVLLTAAELQNATYDAAILDLLRHILRTHDLIIAGYSGFDPALADIIASEVSGLDTRLFWCNPRQPSAESPLYSQIHFKVRYVPANFDQLMTAIGRPVLERPALVPAESGYIRCLFEWRLDYCNREYIKAYGERAGRSLVDTFARRESIERSFARFLLPNRPLAVLVGPSGFGKTTTGIRLAKAWAGDNSRRILLIRARSLPESGDLEQQVAQQLGGLGPHSPFSLFKLEHWLRESGLRLVLYVDGINEFSTDLMRCVHFFRNILRLCYFLSEEDSALRIIATVRQETWNVMLPHLDILQLRKALWSDSESPQAISTVVCGPFTDNELADALARLRREGYAHIDANRLTSSMTEQMRDPYLLGMLADAVNRGLPPLPSASVFQRAFEEKLRQRNSFIDTATLKEILSSVTIKCLARRQDCFRELDVEPAALRGEVVRLMKDLHVFVDAGDGYLRFDHDRTFEYFLALGLMSGTGPHLETMEELCRFVREFRTESKPMAAARLYFLLAPDRRFSLLSEALKILDDGRSAFTTVDRESLFGFAREVLLDMIEQGESIAEQYLEDGLQASREGVIGERQARALVQCAAALPPRKAVALLTKVTQPEASLAQTEARIYATDKLVKEFFTSGCPLVNFLEAEPYHVFFCEESLPIWQSLGRLLGFAGQIGPDNTHPEEYLNFWRALDCGLTSMLASKPWLAEHTREFGIYFLANCDRLLFNATPRGIQRFFGNPKRVEINQVFEKLAAGGVLDLAGFRILEPYTQSLAADIEYHLAHALFVLSSLNNLEATLKLTEQRFAEFTNDTAPEEIDFFHAVLVYLHIFHNHTYDKARFGWWEEKILSEWPEILLYRPGVERGERRGFQDMFDRIFEDGFGVLYSYGLLTPSLNRSAVHFAEYKATVVGEHTQVLPLYSHFLDTFLGEGRIDEALQVLQALAGVIIVWPAEGLATLRSVIGHPEPRIRRATIRILAEAFSRYPDETIRFLKTSGASVSDEDLLEIKVRQDSRIGRRQVEETEWARIGHFLMRRKGFKAAFTAALRALIRAENLDQAIAEMLQAIGLSGAGR